MHLKLLLSALVLALSWSLGYSCSCYPASLKKLYCDSSFVARFYIRSELKVPGGSDPDYNYYDYDAEGFYRVVMLGNPWKLPEGFENVNLKRLYTPANGGMCGVYLQRRRKYLISGRSYGGKLSISLCSSIAISGRPPKEVKRLKRFPDKCE